MNSDNYAWWRVEPGATTIHARSHARPQFTLCGRTFAKREGEYVGPDDGPNEWEVYYCKTCTMRARERYSDAE